MSSTLHFKPLLSVVLLGAAISTLSGCGTTGNDTTTSSLALNTSLSTPTSLQIAGLVPGGSYTNAAVTMTGATTVQLESGSNGNPDSLNGVVITGDTGQTATFNISPPNNQPAGVYRLIFEGTDGNGDYLGWMYLVNIVPDASTAPQTFDVITSSSNTQTLSLSRVNIEGTSCGQTVTFQVLNSGGNPVSSSGMSLVSAVNSNGTSCNGTLNLGISITNAGTFDSYEVLVPGTTSTYGVPVELYVTPGSNTTFDNGLSPYYSEKMYLIPS